MRKAHMKLCKNVSNDGQYHVVMNYDGMLAFILDSQSGECCSPSSLPRTSNSSAYRLNCAVDVGKSSHYKIK